MSHCLRYAEEVSYDIQEIRYHSTGFIPCWGINSGDDTRNPHLDRG